MCTVDDFNAVLSEALRDYMREHRVSQVAVAKELPGRVQSYVRGRIYGKNDLSMDIVGAVANLTGTTARALLRELLDAVDKR